MSDNFVYTGGKYNMREKRYYVIEGNQNDVKSIMQKVDPINASYGFSTPEVYTDTENFKFLIEESQKRNLFLHLLKFEMEYTESELNSAKYLQLQVRTYCSNFAEECGTVYDYSEKCKCCGSGKKQISNLFIDKSKMGKKDISITYGFELVASEKLHNLLVKNNITGAEFGDVRHKNDKLKNEPVLYQIFCNNILPPMNEKTVFYKEKFCECCKKSGLFLKSLPYYDEESLKNAQDFNYSYEYIGGGLSGTPEIIVSQKVYRLFRDNKIKGVSFDIVKIV